MPPGTIGVVAVIRRRDAPGPGRHRERVHRPLPRLTPTHQPAGDGKAPARHRHGSGGVPAPAHVPAERSSSALSRSPWGAGDRQDYGTGIQNSTDTLMPVSSGPKRSRAPAWTLPMAEDTRASGLGGAAGGQRACDVDRKERSRDWHRCGSSGRRMMPRGDSGGRLRSAPDPPCGFRPERRTPLPFLRHPFGWSTGRHTRSRSLSGQGVRHVDCQVRCPLRAPGQIASGGSVRQLGRPRLGFCLARPAFQSGAALGADLVPAIPDRQQSVFAPARTARHRSRARSGPRAPRLPVSPGFRRMVTRHRQSAGRPAGESPRRGAAMHTDLANPGRPRALRRHPGRAPRRRPAPPAGASPGRRLPPNLGRRCHAPSGHLSIPTNENFSVPIDIIRSHDPGHGGAADPGLTFLAGWRPASWPGVATD